MTKTVLTKGTFVFTDEFFNANNDLICDFFDSADFDEDNGIENVTDKGAGKFSFSAITDKGLDITLPYVFVPSDPDEPLNSQHGEIKTVGEAFKALFNDGVHNKAVVKFDYNEYANGEHSYTHITASIQPAGGAQLTDYFNVISFNKEVLPATERMLVDNGIEAGFNVYNDDLMSFNALREVYLQLTMIVNTDPKYNPSKIVKMHHLFADFLKYSPMYDGGFLKKHYLNQTELKHWMETSGFGKQFKK